MEMSDLASGHDDDYLDQSGCSDDDLEESVFDDHVVDEYDWAKSYPGLDARQVAFTTGFLTNLRENDPLYSVLRIDFLDAPEQEMTELRRSLEHNTVLTAIHLEYPHFGGNGWDEFLRIISEGKFRLKSFGIQQEHGDRDISPELLRVLSTAPCIKHSLQALILRRGDYLQENGTEGDGVRESLYKIFVDIPSLRFASLALDANALLGVAEGLDHNSGVVELDLSNNKQLADPVVYSRLANALQTNETLTTLDLNKCDLDDSAMNVLLTALQRNRSLQVLKLDYNSFTKDGIKTVLAPLVTGLHIQELHLASPFRDVQRPDVSLEELLHPSPETIAMFEEFDPERRQRDEEKTHISLVQPLLVSLQTNTKLREFVFSFYHKPPSGLILDPLIPIMDRRLQLYLSAEHRTFNQWIQQRPLQNGDSTASDTTALLVSHQKTRNADKTQPALDVPLRSLVPHMLHRLDSICHSRSLNTDFYFYVRTIAECRELWVGRRLGPGSLT